MDALLRVIKDKLGETREELRHARPHSSAADELKGEMGTLLDLLGDIRGERAMQQQQAGRSSLGLLWAWLKLKQD